MNRRQFTAAAASVLLLATVIPGTAQDKQPRVVDTPEGKAPADAVVLFDGKNLSEWVHPDGKPGTWEVRDGAMIITKGGLMTRREFGSMQLHLEFQAPNPPKGKGQDRGNSGVYLQGIYELQVLDSYQNETYSNGMAAAIYLQHVPLVNAARRPGVWQTYDIVFHAPIFDSNRTVLRPATLTVLWNGVLVQDHVEIKATPGGVRNTEAPKGPIFLQDHNHPVKFRNIWVRELD
ncbi:MAG: 3-keto-disaccharide hydrolase [Candidatus Latescibacterota bacterium]